MSEVTKVPFEKGRFKKFAPSVGDIRGVNYVMQNAAEAYFKRRGSVALQALPILRNVTI